MKTIYPFITLLCVAALLFLCGCSINPATGTPDLVLMSQSVEIAKGKEMHEKLLKTMPIYDNQALSDYVNKIGQRVAKHSHRPEISYHFTIVDSPDINAFALPGGYIYINRGLLAYLNSEAQLAAVLAHEVGHVTARHVVRQDAARKGVGALSLIAVFTTGNAVVSDLSQMWGTAAVKGYGREMELEADGFGAEYLFNSGYDPHAMVESISVLKDHEKFSRYRAKQEGRKVRSYHGVFASHPRNDLRLKEVIAKAGSLPDNQLNAANESEYRQHTEGMVFGINYAIKLPPKNNEGRYIHSKLGFSLLFPAQWQIKKTRQAIIAQPEKKSAEIKLTIAKIKANISPGDYLRGVSKSAILTRSEKISQFGMPGHTGIILDEQGKFSKRVAVLYQGNRAYLIEGAVHESKKSIDYDPLFMKTIRSFRPERRQPKAGKSKTIHYVKANDKTNIEDLARHIKLGRYTAQELRLINNLYPRKEPKPGDWIKIVR
jgi:predicted Zn-dependent protease